MKKLYTERHSGRPVTEEVGPGKVSKLQWWIRYSEEKERDRHMAELAFSLDSSPQGCP